MTQERENVRKIAEFSAVFLTLDDEGQDCILAVLRSLGFAQSVMCLFKEDELPHKPPDNHIHPNKFP